MSSFENLLIPGSRELPNCKCGADMQLLTDKPCGEARIRIFRCLNCNHELQLMVWNAADYQSETGGRESSNW